MEKLIEQIKNGETSLSDLLRRGKILANELHQEEFIKWIDLELNGYDEATDLDYPLYRKLYGKAKFYNPYYGSWFPVIISDPKGEKMLLNMHAKQSIGQIEELIKSGSQEYLMPYSASTAKIIMQGSPIQTDVALIISRASLVGIIERAKNKLLDWAIENQKEKIPLENESDDLKEIIKTGESDSLEFKSSLRWDYRKNQINEEMEYVVAKTITAFLNSEGGKLLIGIDDGGKIIGLEKDYNSLKDGNFDKFSLKLIEIIKKYIGSEFNEFIKIKSGKLENKDICIATISKSKNPAYLKKNGKEEFFIRAYASSQPLNLKAMNDYIKNHWK